MKKIKQYFIGIIVLFVFFPCLTKAATELGASTQNPVVGSNVYVQLDANYGADYQISTMHLVVTYDTSYLKLEEVIWIQSKGTYSTGNGTITIDKTGGNNWNTGAIMQFKFKVLKAGLSTVAVEAKRDENNAVIDSYYSNGNPIGQSFGKVSISASEPSTSTIIGSLYVEGYTMQPTFSKTTYSYNLTVPSNVTSVIIGGKKGDSNQTITGFGKKKLEYGDNRARVIVTAQDGSSRTYEIMIHRTDDRTGDTSLKSLSVSNTNIKYEEGKTTYEATVSRSVDSVLITGRTTDINATLNGTGKKSLVIGENNFTLTVTSSGGKTATYNIKITRSTEELQTITNSSKLLSLKVNNLVLDLSNNKTKWLYGIGKEYSELSIDAIPESTTATVTIEGNEKLKTGINQIRITVTENTEEKTEYILLVYKNPSDVTIVNDLENVNVTGDILYTTANTSSQTISSSVLKSLTENNNKLYYNVVNIYNGLLYQIVLNKNLPEEDFELMFTKTAENPLTYKSNIPEGNEVLLYMNEMFKDDQVVKIYTYNEMGKYTLLTAGVTVKDGYITFTTNGEENYVITTSTLIDEKGPFDLLVSKYKMYIIGGILLLIGIFVFIYYINKRKKQKETNEPLY